MSNKKISYTVKDFNGLREELLKFCQKYYPEMSDSFNDNSVGSWFIDLVSAVGDDLFYHLDKTYQETNINSSTLKNSVLNNARMNGVKIPGPTASICEVEVSCNLPIGDEGDMSKPNWSYAPFIKQGGIMTNGDSYFELMEDIDFSEQFNKDGVSNRLFKPIKDKNGLLVGYNVTKTALVTSGRSMVYKRVLNDNDIKPFMEVVLPAKDIMNVESIIFKEESNLSIEPEIQEYYIDEEEFKLNNQEIMTHRYFEVDSFAQLYRLGSKTTKKDDDVINDIYRPNVYIDFGSDYNNVMYRMNVAEWKPIKNKFITEYTDNGYLKIIFGGSSYDNEIPNDVSGYAKNMMSKMVNNPNLGILPSSGWTMYCLYRTGGGIQANIAQNSINSIVNFDIFFSDPDIQLNGDNKTKQSIRQSIKVTNKSVGVGGKDSLSVDEIKYFTKYNISSQDRCITIKDYKVKLLSMPSKYGSPFRCNAFEENNKVILPLLGVKSNGKLDSALPKILIDNIKEYLSYYKSMTDYIEIRSGKVYNIGVVVDTFINKNYDPNIVVPKIINKIKDYFDVNKHDMGDNIFVGDLEKEITLIDGVISVIKLRLYAINGGDYSHDKCPLPIVTSDICDDGSNDTFSFNGGESNEIDLDRTDYVLTNNIDSMFEILTPESDIKIRCKLR